MLMIGYSPKGFPLRSKVIDYLSPPFGKYGGYYNGFSNKSQEFLAVLSVLRSSAPRAQAAGAQVNTDL